jgi:hypothetical protein
MRAACATYPQTRTHAGRRRSATVFGAVPDRNERRITRIA